MGCLVKTGSESHETYFAAHAFRRSVNSGSLAAGAVLCNAGAASHAVTAF